LVIGLFKFSINLDRAMRTAVIVIEYKLTPASGFTSAAAVTLLLLLLLLCFAVKMVGHLFNFSIQICSSINLDRAMRSTVIEVQNNSSIGIDRTSREGGQRESTNPSCLGCSCFLFFCYSKYKILGSNAFLGGCCFCDCS
jgi:hypothetical protein